MYKTFDKTIIKFWFHSHVYDYHHDHHHHHHHQSSIIISYCKRGNIRGTLIFISRFFSKREFKNPRKYLRYFVCTFWTCRSCVLIMCVDAWVIYKVCLRSLHTSCIIHWMMLSMIWASISANLTSKREKSRENISVYIIMNHHHYHHFIIINYDYHHHHHHHYQSSIIISYYHESSLSSSSSSSYSSASPLSLF